MRTIETDELLMAADVARLAGVTPASVRNWEKTGQLSARKTVSGARVFNRRDVERFLEERKQRESRGEARP